MNQSELQTFIRYKISQLTADNGQFTFEKICSYVSRVRIHNNILPATGPVQSGGDQGRDFETFHSYVSADSTSTYASTSPVAFACSLEKKPARKNGKIMSDVKKIMSTGSAVERIYFFSSEDISVADRHRCQSEAESLYNVKLEILDAQALSFHLSYPDLIEIVETYLHISRDFSPKPITENLLHNIVNKQTDQRNWDDDAKAISNKFINTCLVLGLDAAVISETKRKINTGFEIEKASLFIEIIGDSLKVTKRYTGKNITEDRKYSFLFEAIGDAPVEEHHMQVNVKKLPSCQPLPFIRYDRQLNVSKNYELFFQPELECEETFDIEIGYFLKQIAKLQGDDYLIGVLFFDGIVKSYSAEIIFHDYFPDFLKIVNVQNDAETIVKPTLINDSCVFTYSLNQADTPFLNYLRLLFLYDRK